jgi:hypothetical protein
MRVRLIGVVESAQKLLDRRLSKALEHSEVSAKKIREDLDKPHPVKMALRLCGLHRGREAARRLSKYLSCLLALMLTLILRSLFVIALLLVVRGHTSALLDLDLGPIFVDAMCQGHADFSSSVIH